MTRGYVVELDVLTCVTQSRIYCGLIVLQFFVWFYIVFMLFKFVTCSLSIGLCGGDRIAIRCILGWGSGTAYGWRCQNNIHSPICVSGCLCGV